ncbi:MAG: N-acetylglucosamine-6-phosphate deacetylase [Pedobacter sp.]|nr:MAG: N-acetylglucosamine-6-phosphate deacetylase [Pedobacter sp.]
MTTAFINGTIYSAQNIYDHHALIVEGEYVKDIVNTENVPVVDKVVDLKGSSITAGFIDLQIYGGGGVLFSEHLTVEALNTMTQAIVKSGTTNYFLTLATNTPEVFDQAIRIEAQYSHPSLMGIHFEGPYLNPLKKGAHVEKCIHVASLEEIEDLLEKSKGRVKMITLAPEFNHESVIKRLLDAGIIISAGHSNASFEEATKGFNLGIQAVTHLFNAMSSFHHRDTGLPGAVFANSTAVASIIADGIHVNYEALKISKALLKERLFLITDAVAPTKSGPYIHVFNEDHYALPDGTLSGSALSQFQAVMNCVNHADIALDEALRMANYYPAKLLGNPEIGHLESGAKANIIQFNMQKVEQVYLQGMAQLP